VSGSVRTAHSMWYVDDGAILAESAGTLQRMLDIASRWAARWLMRFRLGADKSAVLAPPHSRIALIQPLYLDGANGVRQRLPVVRTYPYLGMPIAAVGMAACITRSVLRVGTSRTCTVVTFAAGRALRPGGVDTIWK
jgi:hypothetical protein